MSTATLKRELALLRSSLAALTPAQSAALHDPITWAERIAELNLDSWQRDVLLSTAPRRGGSTQGWTRGGSTQPKPLCANTAGRGSPVSSSTIKARTAVESRSDGAGCTSFESLRLVTACVRHLFRGESPRGSGSATPRHHPRLRPRNQRPRRRDLKDVGLYAARRLKHSTR